MPPSTPPKPMKRKTPETMTVSQCCGSSVSRSTPDDFNKLDIKKPSSLIMTIVYICNMCGKECLVKEVDIDTIYKPGYSALTDELLEQDANL